MNAEAIVIERDGAGCASAIAPFSGRGGTMPDSTGPTKGPRIDLRSTASGSAIELDNIHLKRKFKVVAVSQLIDLLA